VQSIPAFYFDPARLDSVAERHTDQFQRQKPFPHVVIDNFLPEEILDLLIAEFPRPDDIDWTMWGPGPVSHTSNKNIEKLGCSDEQQFGPFTRHFMSQLNCSTFLSFVERITGEPGLIPDPTYGGCGLHSTGPGGRLMLHTDLNRHPLGRPFHQRYNLIFYINRDWEESFGGALELWDNHTDQCAEKIMPIANRLVLFDTGTSSIHGHPHPLTCPVDRRRNSLAVYYYVANRPRDSGYSGFQGQVRWFSTNQAENRQLKRMQARQFVKSLFPPILLDAARKIMRK
jgi:Rps23 Pro-64 3,4-dihydroxylase Tpa1-like proline 4-hydroxylase